MKNVKGEGRRKKRVKIAQKEQKERVKKEERTGKKKRKIKP